MRCKGPSLIFLMTSYSVECLIKNSIFPTTHHAIVRYVEKPLIIMAGDQVINWRVKALSFNFIVQ